MAQYTYKVEELKKIIRESQNEFKPKLGASVEADNKRNSDKFYKETTKKVKDYDGGLTDKKPKTDKGFKDFNRTLLGLNPVSEPSKQYKDRVRAQVKGYNSELEEKNGNERNAEFDGNKEILKSIEDSEKQIQKYRKERAKSGLQARMMPDEAFDKNSLCEKKLAPKRLKFKHTKFMNESQVLSRVPAEYKRDGQVIYMKDTDDTEYVVECSYSKKSGLMETYVTKKTNKIEEQKQIDRISELMGYSSSDVFGRMNQKEKINEGKSFNEMMDLSRHKNNER